MAYPYNVNVDLGVAAKVLGFKGVGRNNLFKILRERGILSQNNNLPYQRYIDAGYFTVEAVPWEHPTCGDERSYYKTLVTPKGLSWIEKGLFGLNYKKL